MRVLVVEHDPGVRRIIHFLLQQAGHAVQSVPNGTDALDVVAAVQPDCAVLQWTCSVLQDAPPRRAFRALAGTIPIVVLGGGLAADSQQDGLDIVGALALPFTADELRAAVGRCAR